MKSVNRYIDVLGSNIPAKLIIDKVWRDVDVLSALSEFLAKAEKNPESEDAFKAAWVLAIRRKYDPTMVDLQPRIRLNRNLEEVATFTTKKEFVQWALVHLT